MKVFILLMAMMIDGGNDGEGGLASAEFNSKEKCISAGTKWKENFKTKSGWRNIENTVFYICVEK